jgi:hypothetical protein
MRQLQGDLSIAARVGSPVRCILKPDISFWTLKAPRQFFYQPAVGKTYYVRSHVTPGLNFPPGYNKGVLLSEVDQKTGRITPINNPSVIYTGDLYGEPFFAYHCFMVIHP